MFFSNLKPWLNSNLIPKLRVFKQIGEVNLDLLPHFFKTHGIIHRLICPHTRHQNGVVERKHMHIIELGLTHLKQASLPLKFWDFAFQTAVNLINRYPIASLKFQVPYIVLFNKSPNYNFLRNFGCSCYPFMFSKTIPTYFLLYSKIIPLIILYIYNNSLVFQLWLKKHKKLIKKLKYVCSLITFCFALNP